MKEPPVSPIKIAIPIHGLGNFMLETGVALIRAGASTKRIRITLRRISDAYAYHSDIHIEPRSLSLTLRRSDNPEVFNGTRIATHPVINFKMISGISRMSWSIVEKPWPEEEMWKELNRLKDLPDYPRLLILFVVGLAGAAFCFAYGGGPLEMVITFVATFCGLWAKQELLKMNFNPYLVTYFSATNAGLIVILFSLANNNLTLEHAVTTSCLFLTPGVPLINSISDLMDGEILNGIDRGVNAVMHSMAIALGLSTLVFLFNLIS